MRLNVELTKELYEAVAEHATRQGRSMSDVVRVLLWGWCAERCADKPIKDAHACVEEKKYERSGE